MGTILRTTGNESDAEANRHIHLTLVRIRPTGNKIAEFDGNRQPVRGDFLGSLFLERAPCQGLFAFKLDAKWADGTHPRSLVYSIALKQPRINGKPARFRAGLANPVVIFSSWQWARVPLPALSSYWLE